MPESGELILILQKLAVVILIGFLIGMEREHARPEGEKIFAGIRTFPLISILGFCAALISSFTSPVVFVVLLFSFTLLVIAAYIYQSREGRYGGTSEISIIIVFLLGAMVFWNYIILSAILAVITNLFLTLKLQFHKFAGKINREDLYATLKLAIVTVIVFPLLPDKAYGPFDVLNPRMIWLIVVFVSGISFTGYILVRIIGADKGIPVTGLLGGLVSSTAVTVSLARKSKNDSSVSADLSAGILLATAVMYPRTFIIAAILAPSLVSEIWLPLLLLTAITLFISLFVIWKARHKNENNNIEFKNPFELKSALLFGLLFGIIIFASKAAQVYLGDAGIYIASGISGITSVDAIVVSLSELSIGGLQPKIIAAAIIIATISNNITKGIITMVLGSREIIKLISVGMGVIILVSAFYLVILFS
jgi:uncharacterized membrane protein (DUF4010 family)